MQLFTTSATGVGALYDGQYRVLHHGGLLYVSLQVLSDANDVSTDSNDAVYFGFTEGPTMTGAYLVALRPSRTGTLVDAPDPRVPRDSELPRINPVQTMTWFQTTDHTIATPIWTPHNQDQPVWLEEVVTWNDSPGVAWAITFKVNLAELGISGAPEIFFGERINNGDGAVVRLGSSTLATSEAESIGGGTVAPVDPDSWTDYQAPADACSGIQVSADKVGVFAGGALSSFVQACGGATTPCELPDDINVFRAELQDVPSGSGLTEHAVRARFRIADRGTSEADWKFAPWNEISATPEDVFSSSTLPGDWEWTFTPGESDTGVGVVDFTCSLAAVEDGYCPKLMNSDGYSNQCLLVELGASPSTQALAFATGGAVLCDVEFGGLEAPAEGGAGGLGGAGGAGTAGAAGAAGVATGGVGQGGSSETPEGGAPDDGPSGSGATMGAAGMSEGGGTSTDPPSGGAQGTGGSAPMSGDRSGDDGGCAVRRPNQDSSLLLLMSVGAAFALALRRRFSSPGSAGLPSGASRAR
jgi:hypothetical protein